MKCAKNVPRAGVVKNFHFFFSFQNVFKPEGMHHIFTLGQLKYQNSLIWMKKEPKSEMHKKCRYSRVGEKLQFLSIF